MTATTPLPAAILLALCCREGRSGRHRCSDLPWLARAKWGQTCGLCHRINSKLPNLWLRPIHFRDSAHGLLLYTLALPTSCSVLPIYPGRPALSCICLISAVRTSFSKTHPGATSARSCPLSTGRGSRTWAGSYIVPCPFTMCIFLLLSLIEKLETSQCLINVQ